MSCESWGVRKGKHSSHTNTPHKHSCSSSSLCTRREERFHRCMCFMRSVCVWPPRERTASPSSSLMILPLFLLLLLMPPSRPPHPSLLLLLMQARRSTHHCPPHHSVFFCLAAVLSLYLLPSSAISHDHNAPPPHSSPLPHPKHTRHRHTQPKQATTTSNHGRTPLLLRVSAGGEGLYSWLGKHHDDDQ